MEELDSRLAEIMDRIYMLPANTEETEEIRAILATIVVVLHERTSDPE